MKRRSIVFFGLVGLLVTLLQGAPASGTSRSAPESSEPLCEMKVPLCPETYTGVNYEGNYVGHDEPSLLFYSDTPGSGNASTYRLRLPHEAPIMPTQDGTGGTWNFQLHPAFWFGMALCESESFPNPGVPCTPDSDTNIADNPDPDRIPVARVSDINSAVRITIDQPVLASAAAEHWVRDHIIDHIPGSRHDEDE
jgi:hypothetical protein